MDGLMNTPGSAAARRRHPGSTAIGHRRMSRGRGPLRLIVGCARAQSEALPASVSAPRDGLGGSSTQEPRRPYPRVKPALRQGS